MSYCVKVMYGKSTVTHVIYVYGTIGEARQFKRNTIAWFGDRFPVKIYKGEKVYEKDVS